MINNNNPATAPNPIYDFSISVKSSSYDGS